MGQKNNRRSECTLGSVKFGGCVFFALMSAMLKLNKISKGYPLT